MHTLLGGEVTSLAFCGRDWVFKVLQVLVDSGRWGWTCFSSCLRKTFQMTPLELAESVFGLKWKAVSANKGVYCACEFSLCASSWKSYERGHLKGINTLFGKAKTFSGNISYWNKLWYSPLSSGWHVITCLDSSRLFNLWHICLWLYALQVIFVGML